MTDQENTTSAPDHQEETVQQTEQNSANSDMAQSQLEELQTKYQEMSDAFLRSRAEIENNRKRALDEEAKARKFAIEGFAKSLIPVKDSMEAALDAKNQTVETIREGVETTLKQLISALEEHHVQEIAPALGDKLDPHLHQAIAVVPSKEQAANTIVEVLQKGYTIHERVLRPAMVIVASVQE